MIKKIFNVPSIIWWLVLPFFVVLIFSLFGRFASAFTEEDIQALFLLEYDCSEYFEATELTLFGGDYEPTFQDGKWTNSARIYGNGTNRASGCSNAIGDNKYKLKNGEDFSISFWLKQNNPPSIQGGIISQSNIDTQRSTFYLADRPNGDLMFTLWTIAEPWVYWFSDDPVFTDTDWHQYICSGEWGNTQATLKCYKDGQEFTGYWSNHTPFNIDETADSLVIGGYREPPGVILYSANADIDEMTLFKKILNADERASLQTASILDLLGPPPPEAWLNLQNPAENSRYFDQPIYFNYTYSNPAGQYDFAIFQIVNTLTAQVILRGRGIYDTDYFYGFGDFENILGNGPWKWQGWLWDSATASSTEATEWINFNVGIELEWQEDICEGIATTTISGAIECGFRKMISWAIVPEKTTLTKFQESYAALKNSFPFNVFYDLTEIINTALTATTTAEDIIGIPFIRQTEGGSEYYMLPVLSSSSMPNLIGQENTNLFRKTISWGMLFVVAFIIFVQLI